MALSQEYIDFVLEQLAPLPVMSRRMFGGAGLYIDGVMFALIAYDDLYFKVTDANRADYEAQDSEPFRPYKDKATTMSYWRVPADVLENHDELIAWARRAHEVAVAAKRTQ